jgi:hypothetical protein
MKSYLLPITLLAALASQGCMSCLPDFSGSSGDEPGEVTSEGVDVEKDPLGALGALAGLGSELETLQKELEEMPEVDPLHFSELIKALPEPPSGWTAEDPKGETNSMGEMQVSQASRVYTEEGGEGRVEIKISDWAFNKMIYMPFILSAKFSQESTDGYNKGITVGEDPGREEYKFERKSGSRQILFHKRYHVQTDIRNLPAEAFQDWWKLIQVEHLPAS